MSNKKLQSNKSLSDNTKMARDKYIINPKGCRSSMCVYSLKEGCPKFAQEALVEVPFTDEVHLVVGYIDITLDIDSNLTEEQIVEDYKWEYVGLVEDVSTLAEHTYFGFQKSYWIAHPRCSKETNNELFGGTNS